MLPDFLHPTKTSVLSVQLPGDIKLNFFDKENNMQEISVEELTKGKKVLFLHIYTFHS